MHTTTRTLWLLSAVVLSGCDPSSVEWPAPAPSGVGGTGSTVTGGSPQQASARAVVLASLDAGAQARLALEALGLLPTPTCGEARAHFLARAVDGVQAQVGCVAITTAPLATADQLVLSWVGPCAVGRHSLAGRTVITVSGGEDRLEVTVDLHDTVVDGAALPARLGVGSCGSETFVTVATEGTVPGHPEQTFAVDARVGVQEGLPLVGSSTVVLDGTAQLNGPAGTDRITFTGLTYDVGDALPRAGGFEVATADGHRVSATFGEVLWRLGEVEVTVDGGRPFTVPAIH